MGRSLIAAEVCNCNAPDTGNMEVLLHFGSDEQHERWLTPLLDGRIRSAFCMTEPDVASSDATNMQATAVLQGDEVVINGRKWWSTGVGHPDCKALIFMGLTDPNADRYHQHSMVLVPLDTPGVKVERMLETMGFLDAPGGHGEVSFTDVRLPASAIIGGPGQAFAIAQARLGPGRIHHCMRLIGQLALELACRRATDRVAFGKPLANLGGNRERIADARIAIDQARLHVLHAAWLVDKLAPWMRAAPTERRRARRTRRELRRDQVTMRHAAPNIAFRRAARMSRPRRRCAPRHGGHGVLHSHGHAHRLGEAGVDRQCGPAGHQPCATRPLSPPRSPTARGPRAEARSRRARARRRSRRRSRRVGGLEATCRRGTRCWLGRRSQAWAWLLDLSVIKCPIRVPAPCGRFSRKQPLKRWRTTITSSSARQRRAKGATGWTEWEARSGHGEDNPGAGVGS
jgi:alkylation response protein AidB-like acyl-CoA dehydrogenase